MNDSNKKFINLNQSFKANLKTEISRNTVLYVYKTFEKDQNVSTPYQNDASKLLPNIGSLTPVDRKFKNNLSLTRKK